MQPPLATVDAQDSLDDVFTDLSGANAAVLVGDGGRPAAILTRSDLLEYLASRRTEVPDRTPRSSPASATGERG